MEKRVAKITLEIAEERMRKLINRENYRIIEWDGTQNPCTIECEKCGNVFTVNRGINAYTPDNPRRSWRPCTYCESIKNAEKNKKFSVLYVFL